MELSKLDKSLRRKFGDEWYYLEVETLSMELGAVLDPLSLLKIMILKVLEGHPETILDNADYLLRFIEIANGQVPDPHHADIPTSLEIVYALNQMIEVLGKDNVPKTNCISNMIRYVLRDEGHNSAYHPLLSEYGKMPAVKTEMTKAGEMYISGMKNGG
jgi:hypothetical protein